MTNRIFRAALLALPLCAALACGGSSATVTGYSIQLPSGVSSSVHAGDSVRLTVAETLSDGSIAALSSTASVSWSSNIITVSAVPATDTTTQSNFPAFGAGVTAIFIANPARTDRPNDLVNELFFLDPGTAASPTFTVTATISGVTPAGTASLTFSVGPALVGNATNGALIYGAQGANCAQCHGATGAGSPPNSMGTYTYFGATYAYPALGLNTAPGNVASDPGWNAALLAMAARSDMDNGGIELRAPMLDYLADTTATSGKPPTTQEFADIYAFLKTQQ